MANRRIGIWVATGVVGILPGLVAAETIHVPADHATIQAAIDAAIEGDTIEVGPGIYNECIDLGTKNLVLTGTNGPDETIIDGTGLDCSLVHVHGGQTHDTVISGFRIQNAEGGTPMENDPTLVVGGGMRIRDSSPEIEHCEFIDNHSGYGGGAHVLSSDSPFRNCVFRGNTATGDCGGLLIFWGTSIVEDCLFEENMGNLNAGGLKILMSTTTVVNCTITNNFTQHFGGGLVWFSIDGDEPLQIIGCTITDNEADSAGGIHIQPGMPPVLLIDSVVCNNAIDEIDGPWVDGGNNTICICTCDLDGDDEVAVSDVLIILSQWGDAGGMGDVNDDDIVDVLDLLEVISSFGPCEWDLPG
jgi:hypothetical protein